MKDKRYRRWCFTINNYEVDQDNFPLSWHEARVDDRIVGFICGCEVAPTTGRPHLQGYLETGNTVTLQQILKWPLFAREISKHHSVRLLVARGTAEQSKRYICGPYTKRDGTSKECDEFPIIFGKFSKSREGQGKRTDWDTLKEMAKAQSSDREIAEAVPHLALPHVAKLQAWRNIWKDVPQVREWKTRVVIAYGPPRAGKSTWMRQQAVQEAAQYGQQPYEKADADKWWPGYHGHLVVTIDECHGGYFQWHQLLKTIEEGQLIVQFKGGSQPFVARTIYMTCNDHPSTWYKDHTKWDETNAFRARIKEFGQLWVFQKPTRQEAWIDNQRILGPLVYHPPVRDLELVQPPTPEAEQEYGQAQLEDVPVVRPRAAVYSANQQSNTAALLAQLIERMVTDSIKAAKK